MYWGQCFDLWHTTYRGFRCNGQVTSNRPTDPDTRVLPIIDSSRGACFHLTVNPHWVWWHTVQLSTQPLASRNLSNKEAHHCPLQWFLGSMLMSADGHVHVYSVNAPRSHRHTAAPLSSFTVPNAQFYVVLIDLVRPLLPSHGFTYLLSCVDRSPGSRGGVVNWNLVVISLLCGITSLHYIIQHVSVMYKCVSCTVLDISSFGRDLRQ